MHVHALQHLVQSFHEALHIWRNYHGYFYSWQITLLVGDVPRFLRFHQQQRFDAHRSTSDCHRDRICSDTQDRDRRGRADRPLQGKEALQCHDQIRSSRDPCDHSDFLDPQRLRSFDHLTLTKGSAHLPRGGCAFCITKTPP